MECACINDDVSEFSEVLLDKIINAQVNHNCSECGRVIPKGETHRFEKTYFYQEFFEHRTCFDCNSIREHLICEFYYGSIWELISQHVWEYKDQQPWVKIGRLTPAARNRICEMIEERWLEE